MSTFNYTNYTPITLTATSTSDTTTHPWVPERTVTLEELHRADIADIYLRMETVRSTLETVCDLLADLYEKERIGRGRDLDGIRAFIESIAVTEGVR